MIRIKAPAKVNLFLKIVGKRADGFHELVSVLQMVSLYDELVFEPARQGITLKTTGEKVAPGNRNLVSRAARSLAKKAGRLPKVRVSINKQIPVGAGLGGGSSDAAATLVALNRLWGLGYPRKFLAQVGEDLGSDIPFFLYGPTAFVSGRGERILPGRFDLTCWMVLINPGFEISTRWVYEHLKLDQPQAPDVGHDRRADQRSWLTKADGNTNIFNFEKFRLNRAGLFLNNDLERVTEPHYPVIGEMKEALKKEGATGALMSGSGPTVFGLFDNHLSASQAARRLKKGFPCWRIWVVKSLRRAPF